MRCVGGWSNCSVQPGCPAASCIVALAVSSILIAAMKNALAHDTQHYMAVCPCVWHRVRPDIVCLKMVELCLTKESWPCDFHALSVALSI